MEEHQEQIKQTGQKKMKEQPVFAVGQILRLKKPHPCGADTWKVLRVGMDFRLSCCGCGHSIMLPRKTVEKSFRGFCQ